MNSLQATSIENSLPVAALPAVTGQKPRVRRWRFKLGAWLGVVFPLSIIGLWTIAATNRWWPPILLPSPGKVFWAAETMLLQGTLIKDFLDSVNLVLQGFFYGGFLGLAVGAFCGLNKTVERFFSPTFDAVRQVPPIAILPLLILWLGIGTFAKVVLITKVVFFPVFLNTLQGIRGVQKEYVEVGRVYKLTRWQFTRWIIIPGALPSILVGLRYGAGLAWSLVVAVEIISGHTGLGYLIWRGQELLFTDQMFVAIFIIAAFGFALDRSLRSLERRLLRWKQGYTG
jgi:sulfonate transport system permease protein